MMSSRYMRAVGTFQERADAETALNELRNSGFPMERISILAQNRDNNDEIAGTRIQDGEGNEAREGVGIGAVTGTVLGGVGGLLVGLEALIIPGVGPFLAAGTIATTLAGAGIGAAGGALIGGLTNMGIPEQDAYDYSDRLSQGYYLVILEGDENEIERVASIFRKHNISNWKTYDMPTPASSAVSSSYSRDGVDVDAGQTQTNAGRTNPNTTTNNTSSNSTSGDAVVEIIDKRDENRFAS